MSGPQTPEGKSGTSIKEAVNFPISTRIAVFDNLRSIPRTIDFNYSSIRDFIDGAPQQVYSISHEQGGKIPYTILKEVIENLIHADFKDISITILNNGNTVIISDQGPGITDKEKAFLPGYTSANSEMKRYIRGVGSGLPIIKETITFSGGSVFIEDNINKGTVVSLKILGGGNETLETKNEQKPAGSHQELKTQQALIKQAAVPKNNDKTIFNHENKNISEDFENFKLSIRQKKILSLVLELEEIGPAKIAKELGFSLSTSYRELVFLEELNLLSLSESGKRKLTNKGKKYLEYYSNSF